MLAWRAVEAQLDLSAAKGGHAKSPCGDKQAFRCDGDPFESIAGEFKTPRGEDLKRADGSWMLAAMHATMIAMATAIQRMKGDIRSRMKMPRLRGSQRRRLPPVREMGPLADELSALQLPGSRCEESRAVVHHPSGHCGLDRVIGVHQHGANFLEGRDR